MTAISLNTIALTLTHGRHVIQKWTENEWKWLDEQWNNLGKEVPLSGLFFVYSVAVRVANCKAMCYQIRVLVGMTRFQILSNFPPCPIPPYQIWNTISKTDKKKWVYREIYTPTCLQNVTVLDTSEQTAYYFIKTTNHIRCLFIKLRCP